MYNVQCMYNVQYTWLDGKRSQKGNLTRPSHFTLTRTMVEGVLFTSSPDICMLIADI